MYKFVSELPAEYKNVLVEFSSYYKYKFIFVGKLDDGATIELAVGGNPDDIYKLKIVSGEKVKAGEFSIDSYIISKPDGSLEHFIIHEED